MSKPIIASSCDGDCDDKGLVLTNNRYDGLVIAINPEVAEDQELIDKLQVIIVWLERKKLKSEIAFCKSKQMRFLKWKL